MSRAENGDTPKYQDKEWLRRNYIKLDRTQREIAEECGVAPTTISSWISRHGLSERQQNVDLSDVDIPDEKPYQDGELLYTLYHEKQLSTTEIAGMLDCSENTVRTWMKKNDIEMRSLSEAQQNSHGNLGHASYSIRESGRACWKSRSDQVFVYRLLAVAEYGFDAVCDKVVHHKNGIKWDDRPDNIELMSQVDHMGEHRRITGERREAIADLYEYTDKSSHQLAEEFGVVNRTVLNIHSEKYGDE